jgi:hypothetical protein
MASNWFWAESRKGTHMAASLLAGSRRLGLMRIEAALFLLMGTLLLGLGLPALARAQQTAAQTESDNNLKELGLALHNCQDTYKKLPPAVGWFAIPEGSQQWNSIPAKHGTIFYHLLPFLEQSNLYNITSDSSWMSKGHVVPVFLAPHDFTAPKNGLHHHDRGAISYGANSLILSYQQTEGKPFNVWGSMASGWNSYSQVNLVKIAAGTGTDNTIAFGERLASCWAPTFNKEGQETGYRKFDHAWAESSQGFNYFAPVVSTLMPPQFGATQTSCEPSSFQGFAPEAISVVLFSGSLRHISSKISLRTWSIAMRHDIVEPLGVDW